MVGEFVFVFVFVSFPVLPGLVTVVTVVNGGDSDLML